MVRSSYWAVKGRWRVWLAFRTGVDLFDVQAVEIIDSEWQEHRGKLFFAVSHPTVSLSWRGITSAAIPSRTSTKVWLAA